MEYTGNKPPPVTAPPAPYMQQNFDEAYQPPPVDMSQPPFVQQRQAAQAFTIPLSIEGIGYIARCASIVTTFLATIIMGTAKQTIGSDYYYRVTAKFSSFSALKYFLAANVIVLFYSIVSLLVSILMKPKSSILNLLITIADIVALSMLLTGNGAACAISTQLENVDDLLSTDICSYYGRFCSQIKASIAMSMLAAAIYVALIILSLVTAYKRS
ncbi:CASP-like protein [Rhynchospora pubera]|uniref:CASP-like protein n=1 Tax=Rhynchospora pubera TaxID=906938 RepID=A0AAV8CAP3_9POAL|nr:CASP-like protein [Rhynchospora pubera]